MPSRFWWLEKGVPETADTVYVDQILITKGSKDFVAYVTAPSRVAFHEQYRDNPTYIPGVKVQEFTPAHAKQVSLALQGPWASRFVALEFESVLTPLWKYGAGLVPLREFCKALTLPPNCRVILYPAAKARGDLSTAELMEQANNIVTVLRTVPNSVLCNYGPCSGRGVPDMGVFPNYAYVCRSGDYLDSIYVDPLPGWGSATNIPHAETLVTATRGAYIWAPYSEVLGAVKSLYGVST